MSTPLRVIGTLVGDIRRKPDMQIKYGGLFNALGSRCELLEVYDASLVGWPKYWNAIQTFSPSMSKWKGRFFKNAGAFRARSLQVQKHLKNFIGNADVVMQVGALFDGIVQNIALPVVLYADNTTNITIRHKGSDVFSASELSAWIDLELKFYQRAAHICTRSMIVKQSLINDYGILSERITVVGGGVSLPVLSELLHPVKVANFNLLFIGTDFYRKGGDLVLRAFSIVHKIHPEARLVLVTQDTIPSDMPLEGVTVLSPSWNRDLIKGLYQSADVFILPSRHETWGDVLLEAMSYGLPCIGVRGQAMEEIIIQDETGLLVSPENIEMLAESIKRFCEQPELRYCMGQAARTLVSREFTWDRVVDRLSPILAEVGQMKPESIHYPSLERNRV